MRERHDVRVRLGRDDPVAERRDDGLARLRAVSPAKSPASAVMRPSSPMTETVSSPWLAADLEVVGVVARRDLQAPVPKSVFT